MRGFDENAQSQNAVKKTLQKQISKDKVQILVWFYERTVKRSNAGDSKLGNNAEFYGKLVDMWIPRFNFEKQWLLETNLLLREKGR